MKPCKFRALALLVSASALLGVGAAYAATSPVTATIRFLTDITITPNVSPNFGSVAALTAGTYVLSTAGGVTASGGGIKEGGTPAAGDYTIAASTHQGISIYATGYTPNGASTPSLATCKYDVGVETACDSLATALLVASPLASAHLLVGLKVVTTNLGADNQSDTPSFTLNVVYQ